MARQLPSMLAATTFAAVLGTSAVASADLDETLDVSLHVTRRFVEFPEPSTGVGFDVPGLALRLGETRDELRFGVGVAASAPRGMRSLPDGDGASLLGIEAFIGWAPGHYRDVRPYLELRAHLDRLQVGDSLTVMKGVGPRLGVLVPLSEYFFLDVGVGRDVVGPEGFFGSIGLGLPIPLSHL